MKKVENRQQKYYSKKDCKDNIGRGVDICTEYSPDVSR